MGLSVIRGYKSIVWQVLFSNLCAQTIILYDNYENLLKITMGRFTGQVICPIMAPKIMIVLLFAAYLSLSLESINIFFGHRSAEP